MLSEESNQSCTHVHIKNFAPTVHMCAKISQISSFDQSSETVRHYIEESLSENSRRALKSDLQSFTNWGGFIPADKNMIAAYLSDHAETLSIATLKRHLASLSKLHNIADHDNPIRSETIKMLMRGIARKHGKPQKQAAPLLKEDLVVMLSQVPDTLKDIRDQALLILGFCAALRRSELAAIQIEDLEFNSHGLILTLPRSKTDQNGEGRQIAVPYGRSKICPVAKVRFWVEQYSEITDKTDGSLFVSIRKGGHPTQQQLSDGAVCDIIKAHAKRIGLDPDKYSGHSLRSGLATSAAQHGASSWKIRQQTGHKSDTMLARYIRTGDLFTDNVVGTLF